MKLLLGFAALATAQQLPLPTNGEGESQFSEEIYIGNCEVHALVKTARQVAVEKFPNSWELLLLPAGIDTRTDAITVYFKLPEEWFGGTPRVEFDFQTCEANEIYHTQ
ncbi:hypothetical protein [Hyphococcus sp.]|uniref:hypothetical protein n=1 Tax=Hyphococcus sp. TaxID=2038636 RepID=UPI0035C71F89